MKLKEEIEKIDEFLENLTPENIYEMLSRNGYGVVGVVKDYSFYDFVENKL